MTSFPIAQRSYPVGVTHESTPVALGPLTSFSVQRSASLWTTPGTLSALLEYSTDNGTTWRLITSIGESGPPPWQGEDGPVSAIGFTTTYATPRTPTNFRVTTTVTGSAITLGPGTIVVS